MPGLFFSNCIECMSVDIIQRMVAFRHKSHPSMQHAEARSRDALAMRLKGHTYADIGDALGITLEGARQAVLRGMAEIRTQTAETAIEVREQEAARLDRMLLQLETMAGRCDDEDRLLAIQDRMLKIQDRRAKLLGLDLAKLEVTGANGGPIQIAQIQRVIVDVTTTTATVLEAQPAQLLADNGAQAVPSAETENVEIASTCESNLE